MNIDLTEKLHDKLGKKYRKIGRYSVSDMYAIKAGWLTQEKFLHPDPVDFIGLMRMLSGIIGHEKIQMLYNKNDCEIKKVFKYKDIEVVGKCDYLPPESSDEIWDFKTSEKIMDKMKPWARDQIRCYCTMFEREWGVIYQTVIKDDKFILKDLGRVQRDDLWFIKRCEELYQFHERVVLLAKKENLI
jgi:hypothetical protein